MYQLAEKKGPEYCVIPDYFIRRFESQLLTSYIKRIEDVEHIVGELPSVDYDLIFNDAIHPEVWAASYLDYKQHPQYFLESTRGKTPLEVFEMSNEIAIMLDEQPNRVFDDCIYEDVVSYLNYHHISFIDIGFFRGQFRNLPIRQVW